jgi:hypothetical protein
LPRISQRLTQCILKLIDIRNARARAASIGSRITGKPLNSDKFRSRPVSSIHLIGVMDFPRCGETLSTAPPKQLERKATIKNARKNFLTSILTEFVRW